MRAFLFLIMKTGRQEIELRRRKTRFRKGEKCRKIERNIEPVISRD